MFVNGAEQTDIIYYSTETLALFGSWRGGGIENWFLSSIDRSDCYAIIGSSKNVTHIDKFIPKELTFLGGQFQTMFNQSPEHVQNSVHVILLFAVHQQVIYDGYVILRIREFFHYKARHAHKHLYTVLPKYTKIQVLPDITSCRLMKYNKQAIELNSLLINNMPKDGYE